MHSRIERLQTGAFTEQERGEIGLALRRRTEELDAENAELGLAGVQGERSWFDVEASLETTIRTDGPRRVSSPTLRRKVVRHRS